MPRPVHVTLLVERRAGLGEPLPADHRGPPRHARRPPAMRDALPPSLADRRARAPHRGAGLPLGLRPRRRAWRGAGSAGDPARRRRTWRGGCCGPSGRDHFRIELQRPLWRHDRSRNRWLASLAERLGVPAWRRATSTPTTARGSPLQDAMVAVRLGATLDETEGLRRGNSASRPALRRAGGAARSATTRRRWPRRRGSPSACASTSPGRSATATRARRIAARTGGWRSSAGYGSIHRYAGDPPPRRGGAAAGGGAGADQRSCGSPASSCSTRTCWSWPARWRRRCAARSRPGGCCRRDGAAARASARWSAT